MRVLDLFSGIGGFSLGLERAGMETVAFCEIEEFPRKVLKKHWPDVPIYEDVRNVTAERLRADGIERIDVVTGGFPCQDISVAGKQAGIEGERSGLWGELCRIIGDIRPKYTIVENVTALISGDSGRWFGRVLGDLAKIGYDCEWHCIPASELGAHHHRDRVWIIAYFNSKRFQERLLQPGLQRKARCNDYGENAPLGGKRFTRPELVRRLHGIPRRVDRLKGLGNAVVPQIPELIGRAIMEIESCGIK